MSLLYFELSELSIVLNCNLHDCKICDDIGLMKCVSIEKKRRLNSLELKNK